MEIIKEMMYRDGGTIQIDTDDNRSFFIDNRISSETKGEVYDAYPKEGKIVDPDLAKEVYLKYIDYLRGEYYSFYNGLNKILSDKIYDHLGGDEMKSMNESVKDQYVVEILDDIKNKIKSL